MRPTNFDFDKDDTEDLIIFIKNYLPEEMKESFSDDELYYIIDLLDEYYVDNDVFDQEPDKDGFISFDIDAVVDYILSQAKRDEIRAFNREELEAVIEAELAHADSADS